jgi:hypothetical protein
VEPFLQDFSAEAELTKDLAIILGFQPLLGQVLAVWPKAISQFSASVIWTPR